LFGLFPRARASGRRAQILIERENMKDVNLISGSFEELAQSLRILLEMYYKASSLIDIDRPEAVGNIESALTHLLESFHSLYDAIEKQEIENKIDWYKNGPLAFILAVRNARHHNWANRIRTIYSFHGDEKHRSKYLLIDFPMLGKDARTYELNRPRFAGAFVM
jgi:hypothetical protein